MNGLQSACWIELWGDELNKKNRNVCDTSAVTTALIFHAFEGKYTGLILYSWFNELQTFYMSTICRLWTQVDIWNLKGCPLFSGVEPWPRGPSIGYFTKSKKSSRALCQILEIPKMFISRGFDSLLKKYCVYIIVFLVCMCKNLLMMCIAVH